MLTRRNQTNANARGLRAYLPWPRPPTWPHAQLVCKLPAARERTAESPTPHEVDDRQPQKQTQRYRVRLRAAGRWDDLSKTSPQTAPPLCMWPQNQPQLNSTSTQPQPNSIKTYIATQRNCTTKQTQYNQQKHQVSPHLAQHKCNMYLSLKQWNIHQYQHQQNKKKGEEGGEKIIINQHHQHSHCNQQHQIETKVSYRTASALSSFRTCSGPSLDDGKGLRVNERQLKEQGRKAGVQTAVEGTDTNAVAS